MELLPPDGGRTLATMSDLQILRAELTATFHRDVVRQTWVLTGTLLAGLLH
jgi:hypothetical protein